MMTTAPAIIRTRNELLAALADNGLHYHTLNPMRYDYETGQQIPMPITGIIRSIEREDGSGLKFNVTIAVGPTCQRKTVFVKFNE